MTIKIKNAEIKQDSDEKEVLFQAVIKIEEDIDNLIVAKNMLSAELEYYNPNAEKLKKLICDVELWASELHNKRIPELDEARMIFLKRRAVNRI